MAIVLATSAAVFGTAGCATQIGASIGPHVVVTPRGSSPYGATLNAHATFGLAWDSEGTHALTAGAELNVRASNDSAHVGIGTRIAYLYSQPSWGTYLALGTAPIGGSYRFAALRYSLNLGGEWGVYIPFVPPAARGPNMSVNRYALLLALRADLDTQPGQQLADGFVSLNVGVAWYGVERNGYPSCEREHRRTLALRGR